MDLAMEAGVSQRQLSFIESGRSLPKRETLLSLSGSLDIPLRERNALLLASRLAPMYSRQRGASRRCAASAALLKDLYWNVLSLNEATLRFFGSFVDMETRAGRLGQRNLLHLMFDPTGMRPFIHDWARVS